MSRILTRRSALLLYASVPLLRAKADDIPKSAQMRPEELVALLGKSTKPMVICVAFPVLYRGAHIEGAVYGGAGSKPEGLETLAALLKPVAKDRDIVLYCGCCPWGDCPNMLPAYEKVVSLGYKRVKAMAIPTNLHTDWIMKGYPTVKAASL